MSTNAEQKLDTFVMLVATMRQKQTEYFSTRSYKVLNEARSYERQVDDWVKNLKKGSVEQRQGKLF